MQLLCNVPHIFSFYSFMILLHHDNPGPRGLWTMISVVSRSRAEQRKHCDRPWPRGMVRGSCDVRGLGSEQVVTMSWRVSSRVWPDAALISKKLVTLSWRNAAELSKDLYLLRIKYFIILSQSCVWQCLFCWAPSSRVFLILSKSSHLAHRRLE